MSTDTAGHDRRRGGNPDAPDVAETVLHAERLLVGRERVATERVRIAKRIVTTTRTVEVPVRVEELVLTREPVAPDAITGGTPSGPSRTAAADDRELVVVLHEEVPEVTVRVVAVEQVRIGVRTVLDEEVVTAELGTEVVDVDVAGADVAGVVER